MVRINLALQGGGAHGAFTWGVLDRLLQEPDIEIAAMSGTSAGALNGAALKSGMIKGGHQGARDTLNWLWEQIGALSDDIMPAWLHPLLPSPELISKTLEYSLPYLWGETFSRMVSPYAWGPLYNNPLDRIVSQFNFDRICAHEGPEFFVCTTKVRDGKIRIFEGEHISTQAILASACLPTLFKAVELTDPKTGQTEAFWDGGYTGNPALFPFFKPKLPDDILVININPLERDALPVTPQEIQNRINEISFNSSLLRELRAISFVQQLLAQGTLESGSKSNPRIHMISDDSLMNQLSVATKTVAIPTVLHQLKQAGRAAADTFLNNHKSDLGHRQTADLRAMFD